MAPPSLQRLRILVSGVAVLLIVFLLNVWHPERASGGQYFTWPDVTILRDFRLPRLVVGLGVGGFLGAAGCLCQSLFRNPLASPDILGCGIVAHLATVLAIWFLPFTAIYWAVPLCASLGAALALVFCLAFWRRVDRRPIELLLLIGLAISSFAGSLSSILFSLANEQPAKVMQMLNFSFGSLDGKSWPHVLYLIPGLLVLPFCPRLLSFSEVSNLGDDVAATLSVNVPATQTRLVLVMSVLLGSTIAAAGPIGFIALIVPQAVRLLGGPRYHDTFYGSLVWGAAALLAADYFGSAVFFPQQMEVGICTALLGAPIFIGLLIRQYRRVNG